MDINVKLLEREINIDEENEEHLFPIEELSKWFKTSN